MVDTNSSTGKVMASCDGRRMTIECGGAIGVFGIGGQAGEVDIPGFGQLGGLSRIHGGYK